MIPAIRWEGQRLCLLDQRRLPEKVQYVVCEDFQEVSRAIRDMVVRGAPAIGIAGGYGVTLAFQRSRRNLAKRQDTRRSHILEKGFLNRAAGELVSSRPTAVNLRWAVDRVMARAIDALEQDGIERACEVAESEARDIEAADVRINRRIGEFGAALIKQGSGVLTHCNAGALATGGYGTALGVIRKAWEDGKIAAVYANETRPFLQGARLTAWELLQDGIDVTLLVDSAAGYLMSKGRVDCVIVGADRIAKSGDTANKIGTYMLACLARAHGIPFYVAAPVSTFDLSIETGDSIPVEERAADEVLSFQGRVVAPEGAKALNPSFDVTPASLISGIITEKGVIFPPIATNLPEVVFSGLDA